MFSIKRASRRMEIQRLAKPFSSTKPTSDWQVLQHWVKALVSNVQVDAST